MKTRRSILFLWIVFTVMLLSAAENDVIVSVKYPEKNPHFGKYCQYPENVFAFDFVQKWFAGGSLQGNWASATPVDVDNGEKRRGMKFSFWFGQNSQAPDWMYWQYRCNPEININGAKCLIFDIFPLTPIKNPVYARFGSEGGFGKLACCWSPVLHDALKVGEWNRVEIPVFQTRQAIDQLRFDTQKPANDNGKPVEFIIAGMRFEPSPKPVTAIPCFGFAESEFGRGLWIPISGKSNLLADEAIKLHIELAVNAPAKGTLKIMCAEKIWMQPVSLKSPYSQIDIELPEMGKGLTDGNHEFKVGIELSGGEKIFESSMPMTVRIFSIEEFNRRLADLDKRYQEANRRYRSLTENGISAKMPLVSLATLELFLKYFLKDDFERQKEYPIAFEEIELLNQLAGKLEEELTLYEKGYREPSVNAYNPDLPLTIKNGELYQNGAPILMIGPLTWGTAEDWCRFAERFGFNSIGVEMNPQAWVIDDEGTQPREMISCLGIAHPVIQGSKNIFQQLLQNSYKHRLALNLLISPHYINRLPARFANAKSGEAGHGNFPFDILQPETAALFEQIASEVGGELKKFPNVVSIGIANEPAYEISNRAGKYQCSIREGLKQKYCSDISVLNRAWNLNLNNFDTITLSMIYDLIKKGNPAVTVDFNTLHSQMVTSFYNQVREQWHTIVPNRFVWIKLMGRIGYEMLDESDNIRNAQDVAGTDGAEDYFLDHLRSVAPEKPIVNEEWHFVSGAWNDQNLLAQRMFRGIQRGLRVGNIWNGSRIDWSTQLNGMGESFSRYPLGLNMIGRTSLKLRMFTNEMVRFRNLNGGRVRLMYDKYEHAICGDSYLKKFKAIYRLIQINADGVGYFYPSECRNEIPQRIDLIASPGMQFSDGEMIGYLERWIRKGGTLWITTPCELRNYHSRPTPASQEMLDMLASIGKHTLEAGEIIVGEEAPDLKKYFGSPFSGTPSVECRLAQFDEKASPILSIVNLSSEKQRVLLDLGKLPPRWKDIWNRNTAVDLSGELDLNPYQVLLLTQ